MDGKRFLEKNIKIRKEKYEKKYIDLASCGGAQFV